jgi:hypothetical protein
VVNGVSDRYIGIARLEHDDDRTGSSPWQVAAHNTESAMRPSPV